MDDGFDDIEFDLDEFTSKSIDFNKINLMDNFNGNDVVHKRGLKTNIEVVESVDQLGQFILGSRRALFRAPNPQPVRQAEKLSDRIEQVDRVPGKQTRQYEASADDDLHWGLKEKEDHRHQKCQEEGSEKLPLDINIEVGR